MDIVLTDIPSIYAVWYNDDYEYSGTYEECQEFIDNNKQQDVICTQK